MENIFHSLLRTSLHSGSLGSRTSQPHITHRAAARAGSEPQMLGGELGQAEVLGPTSCLPVGAQGRRERSSKENAPNPNPALRTQA